MKETRSVTNLFDENFKSIGSYDVMYFMKDGGKTMCPDLDKPRE